MARFVVGAALINAEAGQRLGGKIDGPAEIAALDLLRHRRVVTLVLVDVRRELAVDRVCDRIGIDTAIQLLLGSTNAAGACLQLCQPRLVRRRAGSTTTVDQERLIEAHRAAMRIAERLDSELAVGNSALRAGALRDRNPGFTETCERLAAHEVVRVIDPGLF